MDTLVIVRKIREAEGLADAGKHSDARGVLEPLLGNGGLSPAHRSLITRKIDLFEKQRNRLTRIISRRATAVSVRSRADETEPGIEQMQRPETTEVYRAPETETEVPGAPATPIRREDIEEASKRGVARMVILEREKTEARSAQARADVQASGEDSQELDPVAEDSLSAQSEHGEDPRKTAQFEALPPQTSDGSDTQELKAESGPVLTRFGMQDSMIGEPGDTPIPGRVTRDTPVPGSPIPPAALTVRGSQAMEIPVRNLLLEPEDAVLPGAPGTDYFTASDRPGLGDQSTCSRSNPELMALADRLPDDDLRRELALEVMRLRQQLSMAGSGTEQVPVPGSTRVAVGEKPESGQFSIPASQVNTIVRRAAGTDQIEVHMPDRDDEAKDLEVLRKDSVRGRKVYTAPTDRIALAEDIIDAASLIRPSALKPTALLLGILAFVGLIGWVIYYSYTRF